MKKPIDIVAENKESQIDEASLTELSLENLFSEAHNLFSLLDTISAHIRKIESSLIELKANFPFRFALGESLRNRVQAELVTINRWYLAWESLEENQKTYRLQLIVEKWEGRYQSFIDPNDPDRPYLVEERIIILSKKPFIEIPLEDRVKFAQYLYPFIHAFSAHLREHCIAIEFSLREVSFKEELPF